MSLVAMPPPNQSENASGVELRSHPPVFWESLGVFWCALLLSWSAGAWLQSKSMAGGLALTEILFFAFPALVFLRRRRGLLSAEPFLRPPLKVLPWAMLIALCIIAVAVAKGVSVRSAFGLSLPAHAFPVKLLLIMATLPPLCEELVMRPVLQRGLALYWGPRKAVLAAALLFGLLHASWLRFGETFVLGLFCGILYLKTGNYWVCVLYHAIANAVGPLLFQRAAQLGWLLNSATGIILVLLAAVILGQITPRAQTGPVRGLRRRLDWLFFGGATVSARFTSQRRMAVGFWAGVGFLVLVLSAVLPFELKVSPRPAFAVGGDLVAEESTTRSFPFDHAGGKLLIALRADTLAGYVTFAIHAPDGRLLGQQSGGGLTLDRWILTGEGAGNYSLKVTPHQAKGTWQVNISTLR